MTIRLALLAFAAFGIACADVELCDDGVDNDGDQLVDCDDPVCGLDDVCGACGNGLLDEDIEGCDDGNRIGGDGCDAGCLLELCGNNVIDVGEQCDDGGFSSGTRCTHRCQFARCGDGLLQPVELCDDGDLNGVPGGACDAACRTEGVCGDGAVNTSEACDDGNGDGGDGCDAACRVERCGDGNVSQGEGCDDGNSVSGDGCLDCLPEICGNARVDPDEECDEGVATDACIECQRVRCGNFRMEPGEDCDFPREPACVACFIPTMEMGDWQLDLEARAPEWGNQPFPFLALDDDRFVAADGVQRIEGEIIVLESIFPRTGPVSALRTGDELHLLECTPSGIRVDTNAGLQLGRCDALAILDSDGDGDVEVWRAADGEVTGFDVVDDGALIFVERLRQDVGAAAGFLTVVHGDVDQLFVIDDEGLVWQLGADIAPAGFTADAIFAVDVDRDGVEELAWRADNQLFIGGVAGPAPLGDVTIGRGDLDLDGVDDVLLVTRIRVAVLLSSDGYAVSRSALSPSHTVAGVVGGRLVLGGSEHYVRALRPRDVGN
ncbi:MAG: hypothetical protein Q8O67_09835 [Deltaproteobacteria bacterium]|nr:hypothetical protein [Deltaproteobacteria bacterium]